MSISAMKMALEALEGLIKHDNYYIETGELNEEGVSAIEALRQAIEQAEKQPIDLDALGIPHGTPFQPAQKAEKQEPVAWVTAGKHTAPLKVYAAPSKREWVGLTRAERFEIEKDMSKYYDYQHECKTVCLPEFAAAIEAKLKEKNGG